MSSLKALREAHEKAIAEKTIVSVRGEVFVFSFHHSGDVQTWKVDGDAKLDVDNEEKYLAKVLSKATGKTYIPFEAPHYDLYKFVLGPYQDRNQARKQNPTKEQRNDSQFGEDKTDK